jgi:hypothetical protein
MLAASPALACTGQSVHLEGDFKTSDLGWGQEDGQFQVTGKEAVVTPQPGTQTARWDTGVSLTDLDVCVTVTMPTTAADASRTYAGLVFWLTDKTTSLPSLRRTLSYGRADPQDVGDSPAYGLRLAP